MLVISFAVSVRLLLFYELSVTIVSCRDGRLLASGVPWIDLLESSAVDWRCFADNLSNQNIYNLSS